MCAERDKILGIVPVWGERKSASMLGRTSGDVQGTSMLQHSKCQFYVIIFFSFVFNAHNTAHGFLLFSLLIQQGILISMFQ